MKQLDTATASRGESIVTTIGAPPTPPETRARRPRGARRSSVVDEPIYEFEERRSPFAGLEHIRDFPGGTREEFGKFVEKRESIKWLKKVVEEREQQRRIEREPPTPIPTRRRGAEIAKDIERVGELLSKTPAERLEKPITRKHERSFREYGEEAMEQKGSPEIQEAMATWGKSGAKGLEGVRDVIQTFHTSIVIQGHATEETAKEVKEGAEQGMKKLATALRGDKAKED